MYTEIKRWGNSASTLLLNIALNAFTESPRIFLLLITCLGYELWFGIASIFDADIVTVGRIILGIGVIASLIRYQLNKEEDKATTRVSIIVVLLLFVCAELVISWNQSVCEEIPFSMFCSKQMLTNNTLF